MGKSDRPLVSLIDCSGIKSIDLEFVQEGTGPCISDIHHLPINGKTRKLFENVSVESHGGFYQTKIYESIQITTQFSTITGLSANWFDITQSAGNLLWDAADLQLESLGASRVLKIDADGFSRLQCRFRGGNLQSSKGGIFDIRVAGRAKTVLSVSDYEVVCLQKFRNLVGSEESSFHETITDTTVEQIKNSTVSLLACEVMDSHFYRCAYTNSSFLSDADVPLDVTNSSGSGRIVYKGTNNEFINRGSGGVFKSNIREQSKFSLECSSENAQSFDGVVEDVSASDLGAFEMTRSSYNLSTDQGSLLFFTGSGNSSIVHKLNNVNLNAGSDPHQKRESINRLDLCGESAYKMTSNGLTENFDLRENEVGTRNLIRESASAEKTRLNTFVNMGMGTGYKTSTHDSARFLANTSNFQGRAGKCFETDTNGDSIYTSQKANMILNTGTLVSLSHNSSQPLDNIVSVSGIVRMDDSAPLYTVSSENENHGAANLRLTNTVLRCESSDPDATPVITMDGCKSGNQICDLQLSMTNSRVATKRCKVLRAEKATVNFVSSEAVTADGNQIFELNNSRCDSRSSSIVGPNATGFQNENTTLVITASSVNTTKVCSNDESSTILLNTANVSCPEESICITGGTVQQSSSCCLTGSSKTDAILINYPSDLQN